MLVQACPKGRVPSWCHLPAGLFSPLIGHLGGFSERWWSLPELYALNSSCLSLITCQDFVSGIHLSFPACPVEVPWFLPPQRW